MRGSKKLNEACKTLSRASGNANFPLELANKTMARRRENFAAKLLLRRLSFPEAREGVLQSAG